MHRISRSLLVLSASLLVSLSLHAAPPSMTTSTETVTVSTPGVVTFPSGRQLTQAFTAAERASTVPIIAGQIGWETDTGLVYRATGTSAGDWTLSLQPLNGGLTAIAALTSTEFGRSLLELPNSSTLVASLSLGPLSTYSFSASRKLLTSSSLTTTPTESTISQIMDWTSSTQGSIWYRGATGWGALAPGTAGQVLTSGGSGANPSFTSPSSGITIGTTTANGTAGRVLYTDGSNVQQYATTGTGDVVRSISPTFYDSLTLFKTGSSDGTTLEVANDPANAGVRALFILPPDNSGRIYFGKSGRLAYSLDFTNVSAASNFPSIIAVSPYSILTYVGNVSLQALNGNVMLETVSGGFVQLGVNHATTPTAQKIKAHDVTTGTGAALDIRGGNGSVAGGAVTISTSLTTTPTERVRVAANGEVFLNLPTSAGTTGSLWNDGGTVKVAP